MTEGEGARMVRPDEIPQIEVSGGTVRSSVKECPACKAQTLNVKEEWDRTITSPDRPGESINFGHATSAKCANCGWPKIDLTVLPHVPEGFGRLDLGGATLIAPVGQLDDVAAKMVADTGDWFAPNDDVRIAADDALAEALDLPEFSVRRGGVRWPRVVSMSVDFSTKRPARYRRHVVVMEVVETFDWGEPRTKAFAVRRFWLGRNARDLASLLNEFAGRAE